MRNKGFTLIELLVVLAIIGILSTMVTAAVRYARLKAKIAKAQHDIAEIYNAIATLANDTNEWPGHQPIDQVYSGAGNNEFCGPDGNSVDCVFGLDDGEAGLVQNDGVFSGWNGVYMRKMPIDAWDHEYFFDTDYSINIDNEPCCGGSSCAPAVVVGSYGPDSVGKPTGGVAGAYGCDDIIKVIAR